MSLADDIRAVLKKHGPLTSLELAAVLPYQVGPDGKKRFVQSRDICRYLIDMSSEPKRKGATPILRRLPDGRYQWLRDPPPKMTPEQAREAARAAEQRRNAKRKAERHARGIIPQSQRGLTIKSPRERDFSTRAENASKAQAINRRELGLRDMAAFAAPCTEAWRAANPDKYEVLSPGKVSPAGQFRKLENV